MLKLAIERRERAGTTNARRLRAAGKIPVVLYGHGTKPESLSADARTIEELLVNGGQSGMITIEEKGKAKDTALVREVQRDPVTHRLLHVDLLRVSAHENVRTRVRVAPNGNPRGVREFGGVMDVLVHDLEIEGPVDSIPQQLEIDVNELALHQHVTAAEIPLPKGFTLVTPPDTIVISIESSKTARQLEEAAAPPTEVVQPEVIGETPAAPETSPAE
jgi:large subunit ribosomal protein L25